MNNTTPPLPPAPPAAPAAPSGLTASMVNGFQANLSWTGVSGAHSYNVKRATTSGGPYMIVENVGGTSFTDKDVPAGTHYYAITAVNDGGESSPSAQASITTQPAGSVQVARYEMEGNVNDSTGHNWHGTATGTPVYLEGKVGGKAIDLDGTDDYVLLPDGVASWDDITVAAWVFWDGGNAWQRVFDFGNSRTDYLFLTPYSSGGKLRFAIKCGGGEQALEAAALPTGQWVHVAVTLGGDTGALYVNGSAVASSTAMTLNPSLFKPKWNFIGKSQWPDPLFNGKIDDFRIYSYALTASQISALAGGEGGGGSSEVPAAPSNLAATAVSSSQINLAWTDNSGDEDKFEIERSTDNATFAKIAEVASDLTTYSNTGLTKNTTYYYRVRACNANGCSAYSNTASAKTKPR